MGINLKFLFHTHLTSDYPDTISSLREEYPEHLFAVADSKEKLFTDITDADVLIDHRASEELLNTATQLKWLFVPFTGTNGVPFNLLQSHGVRVSNNHGNAALVAERAFALTLSLLGRVSEFDRGMRRGHWFRNKGGTNPYIFWQSLRGRRVFILGTGAIGREIAALLKPFDCEILGWRRNPGAVKPPEIDRMAESLEEGLKYCDVCYVTLPLTDSTRGLLGSKELDLIGKGWLINIARGPVIDEKALFVALKSGRLSGAGLDVWHRYPEPDYTDQLPSEYPFHEMENVVLSPHAGSHAPEGKGGQLTGTLKNIRALIENGIPEDIVNPLEGY